MTVPILFHDPTSEPSRAVFWFAAEAGIELEVRYTWLTRGEHLSPEFVALNPGHQVPTLKHGDLCLPEASAIMIYLAEVEGVFERWVGATAGERAQTHRFLSWHHNNLRSRITLDYFLPVLLMPAYKGVSSPPAGEVQGRRVRGKLCLALLEELLSIRGLYLGGERPSVADFFVSADLFALDIDPDRDDWFDQVPAVRKWLQRLRARDGYRASHGAWNAVVPRIRELICTPAGGDDTPL